MGQAYLEHVPLGLRIFRNYRESLAWLREDLQAALDGKASSTKREGWVLRPRRGFRTGPCVVHDTTVQYRREVRLPLANPPPIARMIGSPRCPKRRRAI